MFIFSKKYSFFSAQFYQIFFEISDALRKLQLVLFWALVVEFICPLWVFLFKFIRLRETLFRLEIVEGDRLPESGLEGVEGVFNVAAAVDILIFFLAVEISAI